VDGLVAEHRQLARRWEPLRRALSEIAEGRRADLPAHEIKDFTDAYAAHIRREEDELLPMAARLISDDALAAIGQAMKSRRGGEAG
jgi:hemerythrin-like domain-containing protein